MTVVTKRPRDREHARECIREMCLRFNDVVGAAVKSQNNDYKEHLGLSTTQLRDMQSKLSNVRQNHLSGKTYEGDTVNWDAAQARISEVRKMLSQGSVNTQPQPLYKKNDLCPILSGTEYASNAGDFNVDVTGMGLLRNVWDNIVLMNDIVDFAIANFDENEYEPSVKDVDDTRDESDYSFDL